MKSWCSVLLLVTVSVGCRSGESASGPERSASGISLLRDGDIVFQQSRSSQSRAISLATHSRYTHMGIVYLDAGRPMVFEAVQPVKRTPYQKWVARGVGRHVVVKRLRDADEILTPRVLARMRAIGEPMRGRAYDLAFAWDDERLYCSELVYKIYARGAGVRIGKLTKLRDFDVDNPVVATKIRARYGENPPLDATVISPQAMFEDPRLVTVFTN